MSPVSTELVAKKPLAGAEIAKIIQADVAKVMTNSGLFSGHIAYGRISWDIRVILHMDNPAYPTATEIIQSKPYPKDVTEGEHGQPELSAVESLPLRDPSPDAYLAADSLHRDIVSPNAARVEHGLPVTVIRRGQNSESREEQLIYTSAEGFAGQPNPNPEAVITDVTEQVKKELDIP